MNMNLSDDQEVSESIDMLFSVAVNLIHISNNSDDFLQQFRESALIVSPRLFTLLDEDEKDRAAFWMGHAIWNATPQEDNNYQPRPLPAPQRNAPCACGSGKKFKKCCAHLIPPMQLCTDNLWPYLVAAMSKKELIARIKEGVIPPHAAGMLAMDAMENSDFRLVIQLLDPYFEDEARLLNYKHGELMDMLVDAYNEIYRTDRKKKALLERLTQHKDRVLRSDAWQRIASWQHDMGNIAASSHALQQAMRADPDNPSHSLLELTLLVSSNEIDKAKDRARFWLRRLRDYETESPEFIQLLQLASTDPVAALGAQYSQLTAGGDERLDRLFDCIAQMQKRAIPEYSIEYIDLENEFSANHKQGMLMPPEAVQKTEQQWLAKTPVSKPFSTQDYGSESSTVWQNSDDKGWLEFIESHPEALDSLAILDDILNLLLSAPGIFDTPFLNPNLIHVVERAVEILQHNVTDTQLPWIVTENRPGLRLLANRIYQLMENEEVNRYLPLLEYYIQLNPTDNHGFRAELMTIYLRQKSDDKALSLIQTYPNDIFPEILYGYVLILFRNGQLEAAGRALKKATESLPLVADYLIKNRVKKPEINNMSIRHGGEDQAWIYREGMRDLWKATPGCISWLKKNF